METIVKIMDLLEHAIDAGQAVKITIDDLTVTREGNVTINGMEIATEA